MHSGITNAMLENRSLLGNPRIIQISALGADENHEVEFLKTKGKADRTLQLYPDTVVIKPSIVCTPNTMLVRKMRLLRRLSSYTLGNVFVPAEFPDKMIQPVMPEDLGEVIRTLTLASLIPREIEVAGPDKLTFHELIHQTLESRQKHYRLITYRRSLIEPLIKHIVSVFFSSVITWDQYRLLFHHNISDSEDVNHLLGRPAISTLPFWKKELGVERSESAIHESSDSLLHHEIIS